MWALSGPLCTRPEVPHAQVLPRTPPGGLIGGVGGPAIRALAPQRSQAEPPSPGPLPRAAFQDRPAEMLVFM